MEQEPLEQQQTRSAPQVEASPFDHGQRRQRQLDVVPVPKSSSLHTPQHQGQSSSLHAIPQRQEQCSSLYSIPQQQEYPSLHTEIQRQVQSSSLDIVPDVPQQQERQYQQHRERKLSDLTSDERQQWQLKQDEVNRLVNIAFTNVQKREEGENRKEYNKRSKLPPSSLPRRAPTASSTPIPSSYAIDSGQTSLTNLQALNDLLQDSRMPGIEGIEKRLQRLKEETKETAATAIVLVQGLGGGHMGSEEKKRQKQAKRAASAEKKAAAEEDAAVEKEKAAVEQKKAAVEKKKAAAVEREKAAAEKKAAAKEKEKAAAEKKAAAMEKEKEAVKRQNAVESARMDAECERWKDQEAKNKKERKAKRKAEKTVEKRDLLIAAMTRQLESKGEEMTVFNMTWILRECKMTEGDLALSLNRAAMLEGDKVENSDHSKNKRKEMMEDDFNSASHKKRRDDPLSEINNS